MKNRISQLSIKIIPFILAAGLVLGEASDGTVLDAKKTKFVAHRGLSSEYYENTVDAFNAAAESEFFYGIETDIWKTLDEQFVCSHDKNPFADKTKSIGDITLDEARAAPLKKLAKYSSNGSNTQNQIATFEEFLDICAKFHKNAYIHLKITNISNDDAQRIINILREKNMLANCTFISFVKKDLDSIKAIYPSANCQVLYNYNEKKTIDGNNDNVNINHSGLSKSLITQTHNSGNEIGAWVVNNINDVNKYISWGVDYITTDREFNMPKDDIEK